jgi:hypothetical protein
MIILAHRGLWHQPHERNHPDSLRTALTCGFGLETDIRDTNGKLVISHDPPLDLGFQLSELFSHYTALDSDAPLALNIKADGLGSILKRLLDDYDIRCHFCFDMSVPESVIYRKLGIRYFTRESEYELQLSLYEDAAGVWMDMFQSDWITPENILRHLKVNKEVALVSPELHGRPHVDFWNRLRDSEIGDSRGLMLCTDYPESAQIFFNE